MNKFDKKSLKNRLKPPFCASERKFDCAIDYYQKLWFYGVRQRDILANQYSL